LLFKPILHTERINDADKQQEIVAARWKADMHGYFRLLSTPFGRGLRLVVGIGLIFAGVFWDRHGSLSWLLIVPGMVSILAGLLNVCLFALFFGLPLGGGELRKLNQAANGENLNDLTFVGESLRRHSYPNNRNQH